MSELRSGLRRVISELSPPADSFDRLRQYRARWTRRRRVGAGVLGVLVAAAGLAVLFIASPIGDRVHPADSGGATVTNGRIAFESDGDIFLMEPDGTSVVNLTKTSEFSELYPAWSPDGTRIAFVGCKGCTSASGIYVMNHDGTAVTQLTDDSGVDAAPDWSPDGTRLVYQSDRTGHWSEDEGYVPGDEDIFIVGADGGEPTQLTSGPPREMNPSWSPDGTRIAYQVVDGTKSSSIYVMNSDGTGKTRLTDASLWAAFPAWSPDGSQIAFGVLNPETTTYDLYLMTPDGSTVRQVTTGGGITPVDWSPEGTELVYASARGVFIVEAEEGARPSRVFAAPSGYAQEADWQPVPQAGESNG